MRDQLFGDVYDYIKYGLIRRLTNYGEHPSALCWMMRRNDNKNEGRTTSYFDDLGVREFDPPVFDLLMAARDRDERDTRIIERSGLLPNVRFYSSIITDQGIASGKNVRRQYFQDFFKKAKGRDLVVFDPDTGIQGRSSPTPGKVGSSKFLMRDEVHRAFERGHSPLIFVNMKTGDHETDEELTARTLANLDRVKNATYLIGFIHKKVGFFLIPQTHRINDYRAIAEQIYRDWSGISVVGERIA